MHENAGICKSTLEYARICWNMREYASIGGNMHEYVTICKNTQDMQAYAGLRTNMLEYAWGCRNMMEYAKQICRNNREYEGIWWNMHEYLKKIYAGICKYMQKSPRICNTKSRVCENMHENERICKKMLNYVWIWKTNCRSMSE